MWLQEGPSVAAGPMPTPAGAGSGAEVEAPARHRAQAVEIVACGPRLVPRPVRRCLGVLGQATWRTGPLATAPQALSVDVRLGVAAENLLGVPPQQPVHHVCWLGLVDADQRSYPPNSAASWEPPDETLNSRAHRRSGQTVRRSD